MVTSEAERRHLALGVPHIKVIDFVRADAVLGLGLQVNLPLAAEAIELVDVGSAEKGLQGLIDLAELQALFQYAILIDIDIELRHRGAESADKEASSGRLRAAACNLSRAS